ncbi:MAG: hypothetical protein ACRDDX_02435 [Cellulosilyticaceae bacterium]
MKKRQIGRLMIVVSMSSLLLVGCGTPTGLKKASGEMKIAETKDMRDKLIEDKKLTKMNERGVRLQESPKRENWGGIVERMENSTLYTHRLYPNQMNEDIILGAFDSWRMNEFIEECRAIESEDIRILSKVLGDCAVVYNTQPNNKKDYEMAVSARIKDIIDEGYNALVDAVKTEDFLLSTTSFKGETAHIVLGNAMEVSGGTFYLINPIENEKNMTYHIPAQVRYELFIKDKELRKVKVYMVKQQGTDIDFSELEPIKNIRDLVDTGNYWELEIESMHRIINKDKKKNAKGDIGAWNYALKVMPQHQKDSPIQESYVEIILEP